ncbi:hypothetical protein SDC9_67673 [bioreactor metagenome]|uniref:Uncharacterized protein n=1 Tax=bioreactor metagenome TaxID=1076179 RepID=A0A644XYQ8_9ZZZZ
MAVSSRFYDDIFVDDPQMAFATLETPKKQLLYELKKTLDVP